MVRSVMRRHMLLIVAKRPLFPLLRMNVDHQLPLLQHIYVTGDSLRSICAIFGGSQEVIPADWPLFRGAVPGAFGICCLAPGSFSQYELGV